MNSSLNSLKGGHIGDSIVDYYHRALSEGDTRSLDYGSHALAGERNPTPWHIHARFWGILTVSQPDMEAQKEPEVSTVAAVLIAVVLIIIIIGHISGNISRLVETRII